MVLNRIMRNHRIAMIVGGIALFGLLVALGNSLYLSGEAVVCQKLDDALKIVAGDYLEKEFTKLNISFAYNPAAHQGKEFKNMVISDTCGQKTIPLELVKENAVLFSSSEKKLKYTMVGEFGRISADSLDRLWNEGLQQRGVVANTAVQIRLLSAAKKVDADSIQLALISSYDIKKTYYTGLINEIQLDFFIHYSLLSVLFHGTWNSPFVIVLLVLLLILVCFEVYVWRVYRSTSVHVNVGEGTCLLLTETETANETVVESSIVENRPVFVKEGFYQIGEFFFDSERHRLIRGDHVCKVRPQSCALLLLFSKSTNHFLTNQEIIEGLWGRYEQGIEKRVQRAISDLRKLLQSCSSSPFIQIEYDVDGYKLVFLSDISAQA